MAVADANSRTVEIINLVSGSGAELSLEDVASHERWTSMTFDTFAQYFINVKHDTCAMGYDAIAMLYNGIKVRFPFNQPISWHWPTLTSSHSIMTRAWIAAKSFIGGLPVRVLLFCSAIC